MFLLLIRHQALASLGEVGVLVIEMPLFGDI